MKLFWSVFTLLILIPIVNFASNNLTINAVDIFDYSAGKSNYQNLKISRIYKIQKMY